MTDEPKGGRFFIVRAKEDGARCLVEAHTVSAALRRAAAFYCEAYPAKAAEIVEMMKGGCEVIEIAGGEDLELPLEPPDPRLVMVPQLPTGPLTPELEAEARKRLQEAGVNYGGVRDLGDIP